MAVARECSRIFESLRELMDRIGKRGVCVLFPIRESRLTVLNPNLERLKSGLKFMMQIIIYARLKAERRREFLQAFEIGNKRY